ncbi:AIR2 [Symbiodinium natans]|uniref:AIR2 protein n=1 Tax=Symbiodinium natans TaxID=878477 RepID=A0A812USR1_9DINO|nr:AIR2 [Symbiodinium natans]
MCNPAAPTTDKVQREADDPKDEADQADMPFWVDCSPDNSLIPMPVHAPTLPQATDSGTSNGHAPADLSTVEDLASQPSSQPRAEANSSIPESSRLAFQVVPSTRIEVPEAGLPSEVQPEVLPEVAEPLFGSLEQFYRESKARPEEMRRRDVKASFTLNRYYVNDEPIHSKSTETKPGNQGRKGLMSDDGYLTKEGAKRFCIVCCRSSHRAYECPETRCFVCWSTGHSTKTCPSKVKCKWCNRKGHEEEVCPIRQLRAAEKRREWTEVRCLVCRASGHLACDGTGRWWGGSRWEEAEEVSDGEGDEDGDEQVDLASSNEPDNSKALKMAKLLGRAHKAESSQSTAKKGGWDYEDNQKWDYSWQKWDKQPRWGGGSNWRQNDREAGRRNHWDSSQRDNNARSALQKKLERQRGRNGSASAAGRGPYSNQRTSKSKGHRETVPAMRIQKKPSARAEKRARQRQRQRR